MEVFKSGDLNRAYTVAFNQTRDFLMSVYNLTEDESISESLKESNGGLSAMACTATQSSLEQVEAGSSGHFQMDGSCAHVAWAQHLLQM